MGVMSTWSRAMRRYIVLAHNLFRKPETTFRDRAAKKVATLNMGTRKGQCEDRNYDSASLHGFFPHRRLSTGIGTYTYMVAWRICSHSVLFLFPELLY